MDKELTKKIEDIKKDVAHIGDTIATLTEYDSEELKENSEEVLRQAKAHIQRASKYTREKAEEIQEYASENPWAVIGIATATGFLLGLLTQFKKRK